MKGGMRIGDERVERYCVRLDKNVTVYRNSGEKIGYTCQDAKTCDVKHCFMVACQSFTDGLSGQKSPQKQRGYSAKGTAAAYTGK